MTMQSIVDDLDGQSWDAKEPLLRHHLGNSTVVLIDRLCTCCYFLLQSPIGYVSDMRNHSDARARNIVLYMESSRYQNMMLGCAHG